ncbi:class I SAM-dependent methyltransferase [Maridesulfovibrio sp.]|uniref:class I SAM-dependent methyltransferase n=1 Tax=Maridesulfovibrio sp. TaxID=2795000 RepID=UPI0029CA965C|nr:class I SAM-dependent methyltransferase [Maridesulfovibrio sp.]
MNDKAARFSKKMCDVLNYGALNLAMGIGYETGIFEIMAHLEGPAGCAEITSGTDLNERYLREWLGIMVCGGIIEVSTNGDGDELFELPEEYIPFLCLSGGSSNLGVYTQEIPLLTDCARQGVLQGMKSGIGIPYSQYPKFYSFMQELADAKHRDILVQTFLPSVMDGEMVRRLEAGISVCDIGCAEGVALEVMARAFPESHFTGFDISEESIINARERIKELGLKNITFLVRDAAGKDFVPQQFDYITAFDSIHDQTRPFEALQNIRKLLKTGGIFSMVDIKAESSISGNMKHPMGSFLYTVSLMHCMPVGLMNEGAGLGMMWGREKAVEICRAAGFSRVEVADIPKDGFNSHYLCFK